MVIRRLGVWSVARLYAGISGTFGLIAGIVVALMAMLGGMAGALGSNGGARGAGLLAGGLGAMFGVGAIILLPVCYGLLGLVSGAVGAALYNLFAGVFGGVEVDVQQ
jgi:hypothetical protein